MAQAIGNWEIHLDSNVYGKKRDLYNYMHHCQKRDLDFALDHLQPQLT